LIKDQKKRFGTGLDLAEIIVHPWFKDVDFKKLEAKEVNYIIIFN
jgi:hypothetical protein